MLSLTVIFLSQIVIPSNAHAMHIAEGILPLPWAALWFALAAPFIAIGLRQVKERTAHDLSHKPLVGLLAAVVFVISCMPIPVPTAGTCAHPCGTGISAILLGPFVSTVVAAAALVIQALFLAHGGLSTLGADIVSMGIAGSFAAWIIFSGLRRAAVPLGIASFAAGLAADWATYLVTSVELASGIKGTMPFLPLLWKIALAFVPTQLPVGILEGAITAGMVTLLQRKRPDLLMNAGKSKISNPLPVLVLAICLAAALFRPTTASAAEKWQGVDEAVVEKVAKEHGRKGSPLFDLEGDAQLFVFVAAGAIGGFAAGYYWRVLTEKKKGPEE